MVTTSVITVSVVLVHLMLLMPLLAVSASDRISLQTDSKEKRHVFSPSVSSLHNDNNNAKPYHHHDVTASKGGHHHIQALQGSTNDATGGSVYSNQSRSIQFVDNGNAEVGVIIESPPPMCRHKRYFSPTAYEWDTCGWCYRYMRDGPTTFGVPSKKLKSTLGNWTDQVTNQTFFVLTLVDLNGTLILANASDVDSPIWSSFANDASKKDWADCCLAAQDCCHRMIQISQTSSSVVETNSNAIKEPPDEGKKECPPTWDGWQCWDATEAGVTAKSFCPHYIYFITEAPSCSIPLEKQCAEDGHWATRPNYKGRDRREEWTNYSVCVTVSIQLRRAYVLVGAYAVSIVAIVPALFIFFAYKQLRVHRIILHQNLFISMLMNGVLVIIFKTAVMMNALQQSGGNSPIEDNSAWCRILLILTKYSRMTNYMWMFCEGFYLHKLIAAAFAEQKSLLVFYLIGWVFPIFPTATYAIYRLSTPSADTKCWVVPQDAWEWTLNGPSLLSLLLNALFLINIIRVLVTKLRATHTQEPSQYRKAVRATLVLLPLFGLHFLVTIYRPASSTGVCLWTEIYFYANDILDGIQGFLVALIFCYFNGEVSALLKRTSKRFREEYFNGGWWPRRQSNPKSRQLRHGSLGRSVVSTHIYSSVPPSPETNCMTVSMSPVPGAAQGSSPTASAAANLLAVNGNSRPNSALNKSDSQSSFNKNRAPANGKAVNLYVTSEHGSVTENPGIDSSSV